MKRIIALYGHAECGKSRTMNILRELIRENGKSISPTLHVLANNARLSYSMGKLYAYVLEGMMEL